MTIEPWPRLSYAEWSETCATLHLWTQIVGKVRLELAPPANHWWHVALYVTARGLTTSPMPHGERQLQIDFDFVDHVLLVRVDDGRVAALPLAPRPVAHFHREVMALLDGLGLPVAIDTRPQELPDPIPFEQDHLHAAYDRDAAQRFFHVLASSAAVMQQFRGGFLGKASPVHFFWGSFDLAVSRFSGRPAPPRPGVISGPAYSHEVSSVGFWPGGPAQDASFYAYHVPEPPGFRAAAVRPQAAAWSPELSEFLLPYEAVRTASDPRRALLDFFASTYAAGAEAAGWDRGSLELAP
ncbi:MAG TPA: DUF5996 family protein [Thermoanaerobaculia bacterium]|nr:DUF5996 family protein [Thermoanaerobaculia bacterium]